MGLFIGASILTILELFDYAYEVSLKLFSPRLFSLELKSNFFSSSGEVLKKKKSWGKV